MEPAEDWYRCDAADEDFFNSQLEANARRQCSLQLCCFNQSWIPGQIRGQFCDEKAKGRSKVQIRRGQP